MRAPSLTLLLTTALLAPSAARAADATWAVLPLAARGVDPGAAEIFRDLLQSELSSRTGDQFIMGIRVCADVPCAKAAGDRLGAEVVTFGAISQLGADLIVTVTAVDVATGTIRSSQKITVDRLEDLDDAAERIAAALVSGSTTDSTARLGNITAAEVQPDRRREGEGGLGIRVGALSPIKDGYADGLPGALIDVSYWYETPRFAIEPRVGVRFDASGQPGSYTEIPMDLGAYYLLGTGDLAAFVGGGAGLRYSADRRKRTFTTGDVLVASHDAMNAESAYGLGVFGRVGALLFRTYSLRVALSVDYNVTFVTLNDVLYPQSITAGIGAYF